MRIIAVDPGVTGALASLSESGELCYFADLPIAFSGSAKWIDGALLLSMLFKARAEEPARVFVEQTGPMPKLGIMAANSKGLTLGSVLAIVQVAQLPVELVSPVKWKRALGLLSPGSSDGEKKAASLQKARLLFPHARLDRAKDHNRAEAMLIAHWAWRQLPVTRSLPGLDDSQTHAPSISGES